MRTNHESLASAARPRPLARGLAALAIFATLGLSGCATNSPAYHSYVMQGQILSR